LSGQNAKTPRTREKRAARANVVLVVICFEVVPTKVPRRELPLFLAIGSLLPDKVFIVILSSNCVKQHLC
jgi:hypothetical protein